MHVEHREKNRDLEPGGLVRRVARPRRSGVHHRAVSRRQHECRILGGRAIWISNAATAMGRSRAAAAAALRPTQGPGRNGAMSTNGRQLGRFACPQRRHGCGLVPQPVPPSV
jgi:hypothetical protein